MLCAAPLFAALGDETRLRLVAALCKGGTLSITELTGGVNVTRQAVSKHLAVLSAAGLVVGCKEGRERRWRFEAGRIVEARRSLDRIAALWDEALERLRTTVEN